MNEQHIEAGAEAVSADLAASGGELPAAPEGTGNLATVPVQLTLNVGSLNLPLAQLLAMTEGQTFTHELQSFFPSVRLLASDRLVAEGELVRVDGRIGFRVTRLIG